MNWNIIKYLTSLPPRSLNITLLLAGIMGMIYISNKSEARITVLEGRLEQVDRLQSLREDSLNKVFQVSLSECRLDNDKSRDKFIELLNMANAKLQEKLDAREEADQERLNATQSNRKLLKRNHEITKQINNVSKSIAIP